MPNRIGSRLIKQGVIAIGVLIGVFICGVIIGSGAILDRGLSGGSGGVAHVMIDYGNGVIKTYPHTAVLIDENLFDFTKRLAEEHDLLFVYQEYLDLGSLITRIGEGESGEGVYWQYWVNNQYGAVGASTYYVQKGDVITWKLAAHKQ